MMTEPKQEEEAIWFRSQTKGFFRKKIIANELVTDKTVAIRNLEGPAGVIGFHILPLEDICDIVVINRQRSNSSNYQSYYTRSGYVRAGGGSITGKSNEVGDIMFLSGNPRYYNIRFRNVGDPSGLASLVDKLRKRLIEREGV